MVLNTYLNTFISKIKHKYSDESFLKIYNFNQTQSHGFIWENEIREKVFKLKPCVNDTRKYDIPKIENRFNRNENISIKTTSSDNVYCGDVLRFYKSSETTMIILKYKQQGVYKRINEIIEINLEQKLKNILFGNIPIEPLKQYVEAVKNIPKGKVLNKDYKIQKNKLEKDFNMMISISPKVDSKTQRRVQCSFSLKDIDTEFIITKTDQPIVRGVCICKSIFSKKRIH